MITSSMISAFNMATDLASDPEYQLFVSSKCYEAAHDLLTSEPLKDLGPEKLAQVLKRLGNIRNELGVFYMNQAAALQTEKGDGVYSTYSFHVELEPYICSISVRLLVCVPAVHRAVSTAEQELWKKSFSYFEKGMENFEAISDSVNKALLLCNIGRLMRICAQAHCSVTSEENRGEFSPEEALYYNKVQPISFFYIVATQSLLSRLPFNDFHLNRMKAQYLFV